MGYLQIAAGPANVSKAVISIWFRVPAATFAIMAGLSDTPSSPATDHMTSACYFPALFKVIPLIVFGSIEHDSGAVACQPSFIGIDCVGGANTIAVNLQSTTTIAHSSSNGGFAPVTRPACFYMGGAGVTVSADAWHHLLVAFDIAGASSLTQANPGPYTVTSASTFSWTFDDVGRMDASFGSAQPAGGGTGSLNNMADRYAIAPQLFDYDGGQNGDTASCGASVIATAANALGLPTTSAFISNGRKVELAELQIFTGVSIDVTTEINRRAFIGTDGSPANMSLAQTLLGQTPDIKLNGSNNWKLGLNTGSLGTTFTPTGTITTYTTAPDITP